MNLTDFNQSDRCLYFTCPDRSGSFALYILLYVSSATVILLTVCGNLLIILSVFYFKQLHTPTNMIVLSMAVTDFLVGALVLPPLLIWAIKACWIFGASFCIFFTFIGIFLVCLSIYHVVLIAVDRYFALLNPFLYNNIITLRKMQVIIILQWFVWMGYSLTILYFNGNINVLPICPGECFIIMTDVSVIIDLVISIIFPCTIITTVYTGVFVIAKKHAVAIREISNFTQSHTHTKPIKSDRKAAKVLGILVATFLVCLLPYFIFSLLANFTQIQLDGFQIVIIVFSLNSSINPVIYALFYPWFRRCVKTIICLHMFKTDCSLRNILL